MGISSLTCGPPRQQVREQRREIKSHRQTEGESTEMEDKDEENSGGDRAMYRH